MLKDDTRIVTASVLCHCTACKTTRSNGSARGSIHRSNEIEPTSALHIAFTSGSVSSKDLGPSFKMSRTAAGSRTPSPRRGRLTLCIAAAMNGAIDPGQPDLVFQDEATLTPTGLMSRRMIALRTSGSTTPYRMLVHTTCVCCVRPVERPLTFLG